MVEEISPFYKLRPTIHIELGNEPNITDWNDTKIWNWRYYLDRTITRCRHEFPRAMLIAPAIRLNTARHRRFYEIAAPIMSRADIIAFHVYDHEDFHGVAPTTGEAAEMLSLGKSFFPQRSWMLTEYGINGPDLARAEKGRRYAAYLKTLPANVVGAFYYHICEAGDMQPNYHLGPEGDLAFAEAMYGPTRGGEAPEQPLDALEAS